MILVLLGSKVSLYKTKVCRISILHQIILISSLWDIGNEKTYGEALNGFDVKFKGDKMNKCDRFLSWDAPAPVQMCMAD